MQGARKKVAGFVYQKGANGKTIQRAYVIPNNPQTAGQMAQRIIFATVTQAAKFMAPIIGHSFEGVSYGAKSKQMFISKNIALLRQLAAQDFREQPQAANANVFVTTRKISALIPNKYIISDGSLSEARRKVIKVSGTTSNAALQLSLGGGSFSLVAGSTSAFLGITLGDLVAALFGLQSLDEQLTLVGIAKTGDDYRYSFQGGTDAGVQIPYSGMSAKRLVFNPSADLSKVIDLVNASDHTVAEHAYDNIEAELEHCFVNAKTDTQLKDYVASKIASGVQLQVSGDETAGYSVGWATFQTSDLANLFVYDTENDSSFLMAAGVVRSRLVENKWRRSRAVMVTSFPTGDGVYNFGLTWNIANAAWFAKDDLSTSGWFLNEGGDENEVGENF